jgi:hypothetical protein
MACVVTSDLEVHDTKTGKLVATIPLITGADAAVVDCANPAQPTKSSMKKFEERMAKRNVVLDTFLGDLGFAVAPHDTASLPRWDELAEGQKQKATFAKSKLYVVVGKNGANIHRGNTVIGTIAALTQVDYIESANYAVGMTTNQNEGGCPNEMYDGGPTK